jgi:hypothetical protein
MFRYVLSLVLFAAQLAVSALTAQAQVTPGLQLETPLSRMRPIGAPSAVDRYRRAEFSNNSTPAFRETGYQQVAGQPTVSQPNSLVRQAQFEVPNGALAAPSLPQGPIPTDPRSLPVPGNPNFNQVPGTAIVNPPNSGVPPTFGVPSSSDLTPLPQPQLSTGFATIDNCNCVSAPSNYSAASGGCAPVSYQAPIGYAGPPAQIAAPAMLPNAFPAPQTGAVTGTGVPGSPLISFGQAANPVVVGPGLLGQPVAYVPGQTFRNWLRYISP